MKKFKYVIVDDNPLAHEILLNLMEIYKDYECIGQFYNVMSATTALKAIVPQMIFLDIEMPHLMGFELIKHIDKSIKVVVTTSHRNFAGDGFDYKVFDFLSKPINPARLFETINSLNDMFDMEEKLKNNSIKKNNISYLTVTKLLNKETIIIQKNEINYITKLTNNAEIYTDDGNKYYKLITLHDLMNELSEDEFAFVNNSYIINLRKAVTHDGETIILKNGKVLSISRAYRDKFKDIVIQ